MYSNTVRHDMRHTLLDNHLTRVSVHWKHGIEYVTTINAKLAFSNRM